MFAASLALSVFATPLVRRLALQLGIVDRPGGRKIHAIVTPYLGGVAIYAGFVVAVALVVGFDPQMLRQSASILGGATVLLFFGLWDDHSGMDPRVKLLGQLAAALLAVLADIRLRLTGLPPIDLAISIVWIVGLSNAVNLLDNMDGLSSGLVAIASGYLFLIAATEGQFLVATMAVSLAGACLGFLKYNFSPATIFMGDAGSLFLGYTLAVLAMKLRLPHADHVNFVILLLVLALPILDTTLVTVHRTANGRPIYVGGQDHCSHRLVALGMSRRRAVLTLYTLATGYGALATAVHVSKPEIGWLLTGVAGIGTLLVFVKLGNVAVYATSPSDLPPERSPDNT
ncbi:MAG: undecaprenyl/decaprenyl-phosphate alpha-N-acetylglucosaminyl 1-phosphate transferase [Candidatus Wallbacteria bacterium]|nr:undecaprenyl/decaprenyl-phosphate alpha-N-acetylglucosaminyl 1-phosphate transferase [Candidatus Wallbacteria bacterium]